MKIIHEVKMVGQTPNTNRQIADFGKDLIDCFLNKLAMGFDIVQSKAEIILDTALSSLQLFSRLLLE
jgi:hypothetical protein